MAETTYRALRAQVQKLAYSVAKDGETIRGIGQRADQNAQRVAQVADQLASLEVDTQTTGEAKDVARIMRAISTTAGAAASATDAVAGAARAADAQAQQSHGGIDEQVGAMKVRMAKAIFYEE